MGGSMMPPGHDPTTSQIRRHERFLAEKGLYELLLEHPPDSRKALTLPLNWKWARTTRQNSRWMIYRFRRWVINEMFLKSSKDLVVSIRANTSFAAGNKIQIKRHQQEAAGDKYPGKLRNSGGRIRKML
jgi:hypothetical protein